MSNAPDLAQRIERAAARIEPPLSDHDLERLAIATRLRGRRRTVRRIGLSGGAFALAALAMAVLGRGGGWSPEGAPGGAVTERVRSARAPAPTPTLGRALRLGDGSVATPLDAGDLLVIAESSPGRTRIDLRRGGGHFQVTPNRERSFVVTAGPVTVTVVGTIFVVRRLEDRVGVTVERGTVKVGWPDGERVLNAGEDGWFPMATPPPREPPPAVPAPAAKTTGEGARQTHKPAAGERAEGHQEDRGHDEVEVLLSAADAARAAGHPDEGAAILRRLLDAHARDRRAPLAELTLGRLLLIDLGRPREAAQVFAELRARAPDGPFAADALAREAEAWARAGQPRQARARAQEYLRLYPDGNRAAAVRGFGAIP